MNERIDLLLRAQNQCGKLMVMYPENITLQSIDSQIQYLIDLENGVTNDRSKLSQIIIGVQTAREIEGLDENAADIFYKVASEAKLM